MLNREKSDARAIDWVTIAVTITGLAWAAWYVWTTRNNPYDEPEAAWLITPLLIALVISAPFVLWSAIGPWPTRLLVEADESLRPPARIKFVLSLPILAVLIWAGGFALATAIYIPAMMLGLGERRPVVIAGFVIGLLGLIWLGFSWALGVSLPLWPRGV